MVRRLEASWPASKVDLWPLERIVPYERNPKIHPESQIEFIAASMREVGVTAPILVDENGVIIYGHGRRLAALRNGYATYPVVQARGWSEERKRAVRIQDNSYAALSPWNAELLKIELTDLKLSGYDMPLLGFPESQLRGFGIAMGTEGTDPEATPEPPKKPVVRLGDLWVLGDHRILCGDATSRNDVDAVVGARRAQMVFTDPPYGVAYRDTGAGAWNASKLAKKRAGTLKPRFAAIKNDDLDEEQLFTFLVGYMRVQPLMKGAAQYVCHASLRAHVFREALLEVGYVVRAECIWAKTRPGFNFAHYKHKHEPIYYAVPIKGTPAWYGDQSQTTLWAVASESGAVYEHPTQKPVGLPTIAINNSSKAGDYVYEPFSGSGTTIIAAEMTGRKCLAIEIDPAYVQVAIERWQNFTKLKATLDGKTLDQVAAARRKGRAGTAGDQHPPVRATRPRPRLRPDGLAPVGES